MSIALLIIDAQYDFCDPNGALFVPGAEADIDRLTNFISRNTPAIDRIVVSLDTHQILDISHPHFWKSADGSSPDAFTTITSNDIRNGVWVPIAEPEYVTGYLDVLETEGLFTHLIWPEHCLIGSKGATLIEPLASQLRRWTITRKRNYEVLSKGLHPLTEHFGIFEAQVPLPQHPDTQRNSSLLDSLNGHDMILIAGEAKSHCVATSLLQIINYAPGLCPKLIMLEDCMSDVTGMGYLATPIYERARSMNVRFENASSLTL